MAAALDMALDPIGKANSSVAAPINAGTASSSAFSGIDRRMPAPAAPAKNAPAMIRRTYLSKGGNLPRSASAAMKFAGPSATKFDATATTGGNPAINMIGNVTSVAPPTSAVTTPPASPVTKSTRRSSDSMRARD